MPGLADVHRIAREMLEEPVDPVVRFRLMRDVLGFDRADRGLSAARAAALRSRWVAELASEQQADGSWGRFHSRDCILDRRNGTTEAAVARGVELGVEKNHPILRRAIRYLAGVLAGRIQTPDSERNERWPTGVRLFAAATLAQIDPQHRAMDDVADQWCQIACQTFASGAHDPQAEAEAHRRMTGIRGDLRYLRIPNLYAVRLLGARSGGLPRRIQAAMLRSILGARRPMLYAAAALSSPPRDPRHAARILAPLEAVSGFHDWQSFACPLIEWLWTLRDDGGRWSFRPREHWPLSQSWRPSSARRNDSTLRVLVFLRRFYS